MLKVNVGSVKLSEDGEEGFAGDALMVEDERRFRVGS